VIGLLLLIGRQTILSTKDFELKIGEISNEIDLESIEVEPRVKRAEKLFKEHQFELQKYYNLTLNQNKWIFLGGLLCIFIGFCIVLLTFYLCFINPMISLSDKTLSLIVGGIATILTNYVAVLYLKMYSETNRSLNNFHNRLVSSNHLHFGNFFNRKNRDTRKKGRSIKKFCC